MMDYRGYDVVYADAEEKFAKTIILYGKTSNNYLNKTSACEEEDRIDKDTLFELLKKGVLISYDGTFYTPLFFKENSGAVEVTFATAISTSASAATVLYSKEHSED